MSSPKTPRAGYCGTTMFCCWSRGSTTLDTGDVLAEKYGNVKLAAAAAAASGKKQPKKTKKSECRKWTPKGDDFYPTFGNVKNLGVGCNDVVVGGAPGDWAEAFQKKLLMEREWETSSTTGCHITRDSLLTMNADTELRSHLDSSKTRLLEDDQLDSNKQHRLAFVNPQGEDNISNSYIINDRVGDKFGMESKNLNGNVNDDLKKSKMDPDSCIGSDNTGSCSDYEKAGGMNDETECDDTGTLILAMPKTKTATSVRMRQFVLEFGDVFLTDGNVLFCQVCEKTVNGSKRFLVLQHLETAKHKELYLRRKSELIKQVVVASEEEPSTSGNIWNMSAQELVSLINRLETVTTKLEMMADNHPNSHGAPPSSEALAPSVLAYDGLIQGPLQNFLNLSKNISEEVRTQAEVVEAAFKAQRQFLVVVSKAQEPPQNVLISLLKPTSDQIQAIQDFRQRNRASVYFNHLSALSEAIPALGWVTVAPAPAPYIKEMIDAGQFYTNRVLVDYKDKDKSHIDWARSWLQVLSDLQAYVKQYHLTGLQWNPKGVNATSVSMSSPPPSGPAPPAPPPPPPMDFFNDASSGQSQDDVRAALFKELNKGEDITSGLKKVTSDQQTHKNPSLRLQSAVPYKPPPTAPKPFKAEAPSKPPRFELEGKKWCLEYQRGNKNLVVDQTEMSQSVLVYKCEDCIVMVKGKVNSITLDSCKKTSIVFDDIVSVVEFINCQRMQAQSMGKVPTVSIDKTDGIQLYLSKSSLDVEVVTAKSSEINVSVPQDNDDFVEHPLPEQFKSTWTGKGFKTVPVESV